MSIKTYKIESILGGISPTYYAGSEGQFKASVGIDPNVFKAGKISGVIHPIRSAEFSSTVLDGTPHWIITNPKDTNIYVYCANGDFVSYSNVLGSETLVGTPTSGAGNGAIYYNNYIYLATPTDISRYGPLDNSPALANTFWTSTLGLTALTNTTYASSYKNHPMHVHQDNFLYFGDFVTGQGVIHAIRTKKTTDEGDTDNGSAYNVLDLPFGFRPIAIESFGEDLAILAYSGGDNGVIFQGKSALFLWDTTSPSFYRQIDMPNTIASAMKNVNGILHIFHGSISTAGGFKISTYSGGVQLGSLEDVPIGVPPSQGAIDVVGNRLYWGGTSVLNSAVATVYAKGYTDGNLPSDALHCIAEISNASSGRKIESVKHVQQSQSAMPLVLVGWGDQTSSATNNGIDQLLTTTAPGSGKTATFHSDLFNVGEPFYIKRVRILLGEAVSANGAITASIVTDDGSTSTDMLTINTTNFPNSERNIVLRPNNIEGEHNFYLSLAFTGAPTSTMPVVLPITIEVETKSD